MTIGLSTRAVSAPVGVALRNRFGKEPLKYLPLSQFFSSKEPKEGGEDDDVLYGRRVKPRKKKGEKVSVVPQGPQKIQAAPTTSSSPKAAGEAVVPRKEWQALATQEGKTRKCEFCQQPATHAVRAQPTGLDACDEHLKKAKERLRQMGFKGSQITSHRMATVYGEMTLSTNIATTPVPIGAGDGRKFLDYGEGHPYAGKKRRKRKGLSQKLSHLLTIP